MEIFEEAADAFVQRNKKEADKLNSKLMKTSKTLHDAQMIDMDFDKHLSKLQTRVKDKMYSKEIDIAEKNFKRAKADRDKHQPVEYINGVFTLNDEDKDKIKHRSNIAPEILDRLFIFNYGVSNSEPVNLYISGMDDKAVSSLSKSISKFEISTFDYEYRTARFRLWSYLLPLVDSQFYINKLSHQMKLYESIEEFIGQKYAENDDLLNMEDEKVNMHSQEETNRTYRFGDAFKSLFSGYEFKDICKATLLMLYLRTGRINIETGDKEVKLSIGIAKYSTQKQSYVETIKKLEIFLGLDISHFKDNMLHKEHLLEQFMEFGNQLSASISLGSVSAIATAELDTLLKYGIKNPVAFSVEKEIVFIWLLANILTPSYVPYCYTSHHYSLSFMEYNTIYLHIVEEASQFSMTKLHKELSQRKVKRELSFDFFYLMYYYKFDELYTNDTLLDLITKANSKWLTDTRGERPFNYSNYKQNNPGLVKEVKNLLQSYLSFELDLLSLSSVHEFLNNKNHIMILKKNDPSHIVNKLLCYNEAFENKLKAMSSKDYGIETFELTDSLIEDNLKQVLNKDHQVVIINKTEMYKKHLKDGNKTKEGLLRKIADENTMLENVACFDNLKKMYARFIPNVHSIIDDCDRKGLNKAVDSSLRYEVSQGKHLKLPDKLRNAVKDSRRMKIEEIIPITLWNGTLMGIFNQMYWKVQNGLITWYYIFVYRMYYEKTILRLLKDMNIKAVRSRVTAIKVFNALTKLFKLVKNVRVLNGFEANITEPVLLIPPDSMMDIDTVFGITDTDRNDNAIWDKEFFDHLYEWMNRDTRERLYGINIVEDFKLGLSSLSRDMKPTNSTSTNETGKEIVYLQDDYIYEKETSERLRKAFKVNDYWVMDKQTNANNMKYSTFADKTRNFYNFSASGSAQNFSLPTCETTEMKKLAEAEPEIYEKIKGEFAKKRGDEDEEYSAKSGSKTICFAYTGENLSKILYWVYGDSYKPQLHHVIKKEPKKLRHVINSDLVSFVKQTYFHDWMLEAISDANRTSINSLLSPRERLMFLKRMASTLNEEKWCVELDMKDFHIHFGQSHYEAVSEIFREAIQTIIKCPKIRVDMDHVLKSFKFELASGDLQYTLVTTEKDLFKDVKYDENQCRIEVKTFARKTGKNSKQANNGEKADTNPMNDIDGTDQDAFLGDAYEQDAQLNDDMTGFESENAKKDMFYRYTISFKVNNGLISGWKLTSLFGSLFNLTLNKMCELWTMANNPSIVFNLNVLGDDTHLKRRYLSDSLNHISFINMINKIAHPDKQMVSTVMIEFLKKKVNTVNQTVENSNVNILGTLTTKKEKFKRSEINESYIISNIDIINTFLSRLSHQYVREQFQKNGIAFKYLHHLLNFAKGTNNDNFIKLMNSPCAEVGIVAGPLRTFDPDFEFAERPITDKCIKYEVYKQLKILQWDFQGETCHGVVSTVGRVTKSFSKYLKAESRVTKFGSELMMKIMGEIKDNNATFYNARTKKDIEENPKNNFLIFKQLDPNDNSNNNKKIILYGYQNERFNLSKFIKFAFQLLEVGIKGSIDYKNIVGELIYHNEDVSSFLFTALKNSSDVDSSEEARTDIFKELRDLKRHCACDYSLFQRFCDIYDYTDFFELALSKTLTVTVSKVFQHDEIVGYLNDIFTRCLIFYLLEVQRVESIDFIQHFRNIVNTLDFYLHKNAKSILKELEIIIQTKIGVLNN